MESSQKLFVIVMCDALMVASKPLCRLRGQIRTNPQAGGRYPVPLTHKWLRIPEQGGSPRKRHSLGQRLLVLVLVLLLLISRLLSPLPFCSSNRPHFRYVNRVWRRNCRNGQ